MPLKVTQSQRGPSSLLTYLFIGYKEEEESEELVIDNLVVVKTKIQRLTTKNRYVSYMAYMKLTEGNERIILRVSCDCLSFNEKWICAEGWSEWKQIGLTDFDDCIVYERTRMYNLHINVSVRKIEKPEICSIMYLDADFTDFSLSAVNGSVAVHKVVIASHSDVFKAMLDGEWKETIEGRIEVKGTTRECLEHLKDYMYLDILPEEGLCPLLLLALRYMIGNLKTRCIGKLTDELTSEKLYELLDFACLNNIPELIYEILQSTPNEIVTKAHLSKKRAIKTGTFLESASSVTNSK